jgi:hypothetical protein
MTETEKQILETWRINNSVNLYMIKNISDEAIKSTLSTHGGRDIAGQFAHIHMTRVWRLEAFSKKLKVNFITFDKKESPDKKKLVSALKQSYEVMKKYLEYAINNQGSVSNFKKGVVGMLGYYISHESHHRGIILQTMKQKGFKLTENLKWGIWEWNKL